MVSPATKNSIDTDDTKPVVLIVDEFGRPAVRIEAPGVASHQELHGLGAFERRLVGAGQGDRGCQDEC